MPLSHFKPEAYQALLADKAERTQALYHAFDAPAAVVYPSEPSGYRLRAEFRFWHEADDAFYVMFPPGDPKNPRRIDSFPIASPRIQEAMPRLREFVLANPELKRRLFQVEFLSTLSGELLVTLIYHRPLEADWESAAQPLETALNAQVIGRSRKQKIVLSRDYVEEALQIGEREYRYRQYEQSFTQPNGRVNQAMITWACEQVRGIGGDLLELYCGNGNFTLPLARYFEQVLATEVAKISLRAAEQNRRLNGVENLALARLSAEEVSAALAGEREFRRLQALERPLSDYRFSTVFVDPPRAGLDPATTSLVAGFEHILYISCNPLTQVANLRELEKTHELRSLAFFDQFPYTDHMECGASLVRRR